MAHVQRIAATGEPLRAIGASARTSSSSPSASVTRAFVKIEMCSVAAAEMKSTAANARSAPAPSSARPPASPIATDVGSARIASMPSTRSSPAFTAT